MIRLFVFPPVLRGTPNPGPFCIKLETALRLAGVAYETSYERLAAKGPKHKIPFVEIDGERIGDSTLILERLRDEQGVDLDASLSPRERAQSHALQRMIEERLYFVMVHSRWLEPENWAKLKTAFFSKMPLPLRLIVPRLAQKRVRNSIVTQGLGRHTREEIYALGAADLAAVSTVLGDKAFLFGDRPTMADATAFAFLISIIGPDFESPLRTSALGHANLVSYTERMGEVFARAARTHLRRAA
ncbi:MAG: glutathione S-transferase family protein [Parvibaculum sp.]|uniref:glutathione S-transferase family protein n=1 Tax=Parvibaculum sp. TaxID=2024848 RepID=UPI0025E67EA7|nr:glutathione S-transferase family protein [Parvibaculum sp.]MCE9650017.1 glutathione S-transferase family protein [Parvibaculum sp.]